MLLLLPDFINGKSLSVKYFFNKREKIIINKTIFHTIITGNVNGWCDQPLTPPYSIGYVVLPYAAKQSNQTKCLTNIVWLEVHKHVASYCAQVENKFMG